VIFDLRINPNRSAENFNQSGVQPVAEIASPKTALTKKRILDVNNIPQSPILSEETPKHSIKDSFQG